MGERVRVVLACDECGARNYHTTKNKSRTQERLAIKKYCPACKQHTLHKESK
jgi:large subunit ribosomal protein L33